jgi:REP element-mobilizing transposase RayT
VRHRHESGVWWCRVFVVMPDHLHGLLRFPFPDHPMTDTIAQFKKYTARTWGISWQR